MTTLSKFGIIKKKAFLATKHPVTLPTHIYYESPEPTSYFEASKQEVWRRAMYEEFCSMQRWGTWSLVQFSPSKHIVGCKWVFKIKHNTDGSIARYKARLVAKGFHQEQGIDYNETFSPVVKHSTIRVILALAVQFHWSLHQLDATNAFLHGILKEDIYMTQPQGFTDPSFPNHVCKLHKSFYGLKRAPRAWYERFSSFLIGLGFHTSFPDASLFVRFHKGSIAIILLCVDDLVLTGNDNCLLNWVLSLKWNTWDIFIISLVLRLITLPMGYFCHEPTILKTYFFMLPCLMLNQLLPPAITNLLQPVYLLHPWNNQQSIGVLQVLFNTNRNNQRFASLSVTIFSLQAHGDWSPPWLEGAC